MPKELDLYIASGWDRTLRETPAGEGNILSDGRLYLPYPYTVPCAADTFRDLYYWDTYFANRGLLLSGRTEIVAGNLRNFIYLINTYGFIPNGTRKSMLNRSQPPFFGMMLSDYYEATGDKALLLEGLDALQKELKFFDARRKASNGLNHYSCDADEATCLRGAELYEKRTGVTRAGDRVAFGRDVFAEAESGWDFCARFEGRCTEYNPVDLNCLLYFDEWLLWHHGRGEEYRQKAAARKEKILTLMRGEDGVFYDYSYVEGRRSTFKSCAAFFPYFVGLVKDDNGIDALLTALELEYGLQAAEPADGNYQWGADNGWPCLQLVAYEALWSCGRLADAKRLAQKYVSLVERCFEETHHLWEKYNVREGSAEAIGEYGTPPMLGWSAGVYLSLKHFLH